MKNKPLYLIGTAALLVLALQIAWPYVRTQETVAATDSMVLNSVEVTLTPHPAIRLPASGQAVVQTGVYPTPAIRRIPLPPSETDLPPAQLPTGSKAIEPTLSGLGLDVPAFTLADVVRYHKRQHTNGVAQYRSSVAPGIDKIEFLTEGELKLRTPFVAPAVPDPTLLCLVQYSGAFVDHDHPGLIASHVLEVFDAHTGNELAVAIGPWPPRK